MTDHQHPLTTKLKEAIATGDPAKINRIVRRIDNELRHPELWGAVRAAKCLGISHTNMYKLDDLPEPAITPDRGKMWSAYMIKDFARQRRRKK